MEDRSIRTRMGIVAHATAGCIAGVILLTGDAACGQTRPTELQELQGKWEVTELVVNGKVIPSDRIRQALPSGGRLQIVDRAIMFRSPEDAEQHARVFSIDATQYPKQLDIGDATEGKSLGIYQFDGGKLVICIADADLDETDRPDSFSASAGSRRMLLVLRRSSTPSTRRSGDSGSKANSEGSRPSGRSAALKPLADPDITKMLAGTWFLKDNAGALFVTFREDSSFNTVREYEELRLFHKSFVQTPVSKGKWSVKDGRLSAQVTHSADAHRVNRVFSFSIRSISAADMIFVDELGRVVRATRVR